MFALRVPRRRRQPLSRFEPLEPRRAMSADFADAIGSAAVFAGGGSFSGTIGDGFWGSRDVDLVGFTVAAGGRLTADLDARVLPGGSTLDGYLRVFDAAGNVLAFNDDFGGSLDSYVSLGVPATGTYYVGVSGFGNPVYNPRQSGSGMVGSTGRFVLAVTVVNPAAPPDGAGDSPALARDVGVLSTSRTMFDAIGGSDANDYYRFTVTGGSRVDLRLDGLSNDAELQLLDERGTVLATSDAGGTTAEVIQREVGQGVYFARVYPYSGTTNYSLTLSATGIAAPPPTPGPPILPPVFRSTTGWGLVDASAAVASLRGGSTAFPAVPDLGGVEWGNDLVNAPEVWARGFTGRGVVVAVVDTGVDDDHPDLRQNIWVNPREVAGDGIDNDRNGFVDDVRGWDFVGNDAFPMDVVDTRIIDGESGNPGHGTHVAGTIAAVRNGLGSTGVAPDARIMPIRVLDHRGNGTFTAIARGIRYAADNGAHVINLSLGGSYSSSIEQAVGYAVGRGCVVVVAAGNSGQSSPGHPARLAATIDGVISVGSVDRNQALASSSHRAGTDLRMQHVVAAGVAVHSTLPGGRYGTLSGTSMATPHVAGVAALLRSGLPTTSQQRYWSWITSTARQPSNASFVQTPSAPAPRPGMMRGIAFAALLPEAALGVAVAGDQGDQAEGRPRTRPSHAASRLATGGPAAPQASTILATVSTAFASPRSKSSTAALISASTSTARTPAFIVHPVS